MLSAIANEVKIWLKRNYIYHSYGNVQNAKECIMEILISQHLTKQKIVVQGRQPIIVDKCNAYDIAEW